MVPLGAFLVGIVAIVSGIAGGAYKQRLKTEQRLAMLARGMSAGEIEKVLSAEGKSGERPPPGTCEHAQNRDRADLDVALGSCSLFSCWRGL